PKSFRAQPLTGMEVAMRLFCVLLTGTVLVSCTVIPPPPMRTAQAQQRYEMLLAGKIARAPVSCLPSYSANDMIRIDDDTIAFREGSRRVYVNHMRGPWRGLSSEGNALVTVERSPPAPC